MTKPVHPLVQAVAPILGAVGATIVPSADMNASDIPLSWDGEVIGAVRMPALHGALDRLIESVEKELGSNLKELSRNEKQRAVRLLDERGAFILRRCDGGVADHRVQLPQRDPSLNYNLRS
jgi:hypothetical protein